MLGCRQFDLAQHGTDVNCLAVVTAVIFTELLHAENFTQRRQNAKKIYPFTDAVFGTLVNRGNFPRQSSPVCGLVPNDNFQSHPFRELHDGRE